MIRTDNEQLVSCITNCFNLAMDPNLSSEDRTTMLVLGKRLRGSLVNLLSVTFDDNLPALLAANAKIQEVNTSISASIQGLTTIADAIIKATKLVTKLDDLLKFAITVGL